VPPTQVPHLFTPFYTTKSAGHGTGLGLYLSYGLVEAHGGRLGYRPAAEGGAEFVVSLPIQEGVAPPPPAASQEPDARPEMERSRRVLVVDDDTSVLRLVSALFAPDGMVVEGARTADQALQMLQHRTYHLVIADGQLTGGGDRPFVLMLLEEYPDWQDRLVVMGRARGSGPILPATIHRIDKPFHLRDLRALASRILEVRGAR
jgi:CheY-like chemotaxis protein